MNCSSTYGKYISILGALLLTVPAMAEVVTPGQAQETASQFFGKTGEPQLVRLTAARAQPASSPSANEEEPAYHVFNYPGGGWVIISGDDCLTPVLGYSRTGSFQGGVLNENLQYWLDGIAEVVSEVRASNMKPTPEVVRMWKYAGMATKADTGEEKVLKTAQWAQERPFNDQCPIVNGESSRSVSGCVATAMAILLRYHEYPEHGSGTIGGYTTTTTQTNIGQYSIDEHYYNWSDMPITPYGNGGKWSVSQSEEVAQLVHDLGVAVEMDYSSAGSGAFAELVPYVLATHFGYSKSMQAISRATVSKEEWFSMIRQQIKRGAPVPYSGHDLKSGGHFFICDGYSTNEGNMLHINWGWGGSNDGFYALDLNVPGKFRFSTLQLAIFNAVPDPEGTGVEPEPTVFVQYLQEQTPEYYGMIYSSDDGIRKGAQASFRVGPIQSLSFNGFKTRFKVSLMDIEGNPRADICTTNDITLTPGYYYFSDPMSGTIPVEPDLTDYFQPFYQRTDGSWAAISYDMDYFDDSSIKCGVTFQPFIIIPDNISPGDRLELRLSYASTPARIVSWYLDGKRVSENYITVPLERELLKAEIIFSDNSKGYVTTYIGGNE